MKAKELIPVKKEFLFITKMAITIAVSVAVALGLLYLFLSKSVDASYRSAFQTISSIYDRMNVYVIGAGLVQLIFSSVIVFTIALFFSHKIAGPMFRLKAVLQEYLGGADIEKVSFRKTDFIPGVSGLFTNLFVFLGKRKKLLAEAEASAARLKEASGPEREKLLKELQAMVKELEG
ncbi:MAG: hypothetical protein GY950_26965 [bacterium]|nr:hypothetical protein [bacterium]